MRTLLLLLCLVLAACGGSESGYNDPQKLEGALRAKAQARMDADRDMYEGAKVTNTTCVKSADHVFKCSGEISSGDRWTITVTVSDDGTKYVSDQD